MITVADVSMRFGSKVLFEDVTTTFSDGRRYGLTGPERRRQVHVHEDADRRAAAAEGHRRAGRRSSACCGRTSSPSTASASSTRSSWATRGSGARSQEREVLYAKADHDRRRRHAPRRARGHRRRGGRLRGRERRGHSAAGPRHPRRAARPEDVRSCRAARRSACCSRRRSSGSPPALLLDEPTNHLDLDSIHWLEEFLVRYDGTLIVISHDRHFLNDVCTHIADIDYQTIITYTGGYDDMVLAKTQIRSRIESEQRAAREEDRAAERVHRSGSRPARARARCTSRRKEVERLADRRTSRARTSSARTSGSAMKRPSGRMAMEIKGVSKALRRARR